MLLRSWIVLARVLRVLQPEHRLHIDAIKLAVPGRLTRVIGEGNVPGPGEYWDGCVIPVYCPNECGVNGGPADIGAAIDAGNGGSEIVEVLLLTLRPRVGLCGRICSGPETYPPLPLTLSGAKIEEDRRWRGD
nr:hypothetical protein B0A51_17582 [Rachicladosporium sp. CCFEE 5018]